MSTTDATARTAGEAAGNAKHAAVPRSVEDTARETGPGPVGRPRVWETAPSEHCSKLRTRAARARADATRACDPHDAGRRGEPDAQAAEGDNRVHERGNGLNIFRLSTSLSARARAAGPRASASLIVSAIAHIGTLENKRHVVLWEELLLLGLGKHITLCERVAAGSAARRDARGTRRSAMSNVRLRRARWSPTGACEVSPGGCARGNPRRERLGQHHREPAAPAMQARRANALDDAVVADLRVQAKFVSSGPREGRHRGQRTTLDRRFPGEPGRQTHRDTDERGRTNATELPEDSLVNFPRVS